MQTTVSTNKDLESAILSYILLETHREDLEEKTTKEVSEHFNITNNEAYKVLSKLSSEKLITKLEPVNSTKFDYCGWIRNSDPE